MSFLMTGRKISLHVEHRHYHQSEFYTEGLADAFAVADLVISRAGLGTLTELSALEKATIVIPMPNTHQVANAKFSSSAGAAMLLDETTLTGVHFSTRILALLKDTEMRHSLEAGMRSVSRHDAAERIAREIITLMNAHEHETA